MTAMEPGAGLVDGTVPRDGSNTIPVVALGGSAGAIEPLQMFFREMQPDSGFAFVVILHLSSEHESLLVELLQRCTRMPVVQVRKALGIQANTVYVIAPGMSLHCSSEGLAVLPAQRQAPHVLVDIFFRTLADSHGPHAAAVVLSGMNGDGALGIRHIRERGGLTVAQDPTQAQHEGMPRSAIDTGMVDWILPVEAIPGRVLSYFKQEMQLELPKSADAADGSVRNSSEEAALAQILAFLHSRTSRDFSVYKPATILRRIGRRMQVNGVRDLQNYLDCLNSRSGESSALLQDLLISVTNFFRDATAFDALAAHLPPLFEGKRTGDTVRVWVAACATGEEAYSVAMLLAEHAATIASPPEIQIFASDIDEAALRTARQGVYPLAIETDVSEARRERFFLKEHHGYRVRKELREKVLFATHDILKDPAFSRIDLISCRNLLIYLARPAQQGVLSVLHQSLAPHGKLFLGTSDNADDAQEQFLPLDKKHRIYVKRPSDRTRRLELARSLPHHPSALAVRAPTPPTPEEMEPMALSAAGVPVRLQPMKSRWGELHLSVLEHLAPPSILLDAEYDVVHMSQSAGKFMRPAGGEPSRNLFRCVHPELAVGLRAALMRAEKTNEPVSLDRVELNVDGQDLQVFAEVNHVDAGGESVFLLRFQSRPAPTETAAAVVTHDHSAVTRLEREIFRLKHDLYETVAQYEAAAEEGTASNEELRAVNEELRSATEEMETSREEQQSALEELSTVNSELKGRIHELDGTNSDLQNLISATDVATIFIDTELRVTRYTPAATRLFKLIPTDLGRPLTDLTAAVRYPELGDDARGVLASLAAKERELGQAAGKWYASKMLPYRTLDNRIAGVVLTFIDITDRRQADEMRLWLSSVVSSATDAILSTDLSLVVLSWNSGAEHLLGHLEADALGQPLDVIEPGIPWAALVRRSRAGEAVQNVRVTKTRVDGALVHLSVSLSPMRDRSGEITAFTIIARDISSAEEFAEEVRQRDAEYGVIVENAREFAIFTLNLDRTVARWSVAARNMFGYAPAEIVGQCADVLLDADDRAAGVASREAEIALVNGEAREERFYKRSDGSRIWVAASLFVLRARGGDPVGFVKLIRNESALRECRTRIESLERELQMARAGLGQP